MIQIQDVGPSSANTSLTSNSGGGLPPDQSVNGRMLTLAASTDGTTVFAGSYSNLWVSRDSGQTWDQVTWPQPASGQFGVPSALGGWCVVDIVVSPVDPLVVIVITRNARQSPPPDNGIWRSGDGGSSWTQVFEFPQDPNGNQIASPAGQLVWAPASDRLVFAAVGSALAISRNAGVSFQVDPRVHRINHVAVATSFPTAPGPVAVYALRSGAMYVSLDGGGSWTIDRAPIQSNWGGAVGAAGNSQAPSVLVVSPSSPLEVFLVADANGGRTVSPLAARGPCDSAYQRQQHFVYADSWGTVWDSWWDDEHGSWNLQQINRKQISAVARTDGPAVASDVFVSVYGDQQHFSYADSNGQIWDAWWDTNSWQLQQINLSSMNAGARTDGPAALGAVFVSVYGDQQHFSYVDSAGQIWDAWWDTNSWQLQQINLRSMNAGARTDGPAASAVFVSAYGDQQHFSYVDSAGQIWDAWWDTNSWQLQQINLRSMNAGARTDGPAASAVFVSVYGDQQHFSYVDSAGQIWDAWWDTNSWQLQQINLRSMNAGARTDGPAAVGAVFVSVYGDQQHFTYVDSAGQIWDSWWNGADNNWNKQQINLQSVNPDARTDAPAARGAVYVSVFLSQQHFTYADNAGTIWDAWWDGDNGNWNLQQINAGPMLWRGDYTQFATTQTSIWKPVIPPDLNGQDQDSGSIFIAVTSVGHGASLFYGAQRTKPYVGSLDPVSASDWVELDEGTSVHPDLHGILLSPDFKASFHNGEYQISSGTVWLLSDGGIYRSTDGGRHFMPADNVKSLACVNVAGVAIEGKTALSLNSGDNDGFFSSDGGGTWISQDYGGGDNDCSYADPLRPHSMLVFTPRWDQDGNLGSAAAGQTVAIYETRPGELPDVSLGTSSRHVVPGPSLSDRWNAVSTFGLQGYRPIVLNLPGDDVTIPGDYVFIRFKSGSSEAVLLRTQQILAIDSRDDWDTVAASALDGARVFQQGPTLPSGDLSLVQASGGHVDTVFFVGGNKKNELWRWTNGNGLTSGPAAVGAVFVSSYLDQQHFSYADSNGQIWDAWWDTNSWQVQQINLKSLNAGARTEGPASAGAVFVSAYGDQQHLTYTDSAGQIWDAWWDTNSWQLQQINLKSMSADARTDGPAAVGAVFVSAYGDQQHFSYADSNGQIWDAWWDTNSWQLQQINLKSMSADARTDGPAAAGAVFVSAYGDQQHFSYADSNGQIWDAWWDTNSWQLQQINLKSLNAGARTEGPASAGAVFVSAYGDQQHLTYTDSAGQIWDAWWDTNSWQLQQINLKSMSADARTDGPAAAGAVFVSAYGDQQHFSYADSNGQIWDAWWDTNSWQLQQINLRSANPDARTDGPAAAASAVFVSAYLDQQHFAYVDNAGTVWDSWRSGATWNLQRINAGWQKMVPGVDAKLARRFFVSPYDPNLIYLLDDKNVRRSDDGGNTWPVDTSLETQLTCGGLIPIARPDTDEFVDVVLTDMQFDPFRPLTRFAVGEGGAFYTNDGVNWDRLLDTGALSGRPTNCYYDTVSNPSERALYIALVGRSLLKIDSLP